MTRQVEGSSEPHSSLHIELPAAASAELRDGLHSSLEGLGVQCEPIPDCPEIRQSEHRRPEPRAGPRRQATPPEQPEVVSGAALPDDDRGEKDRPQQREEDPVGPEGQL